MSVVPRSNINNNNNNNNNNNAPSASYILRGHSSAIQTLQASDDGSSLLSGTSEGEIKLWNMHTKRCLSTVQLPGGGTGVVKLHQIDTNNFISQDSLGKLVSWSLKESSVVMQSEWDPYGVYADHRSPLWESTPVPFAKSALNHNSPNIVAIAAGHREFEYIDLLDIRERSLVQTYKDKEKLGLCMYMKIYKAEGKETELICGAFENGSLRWWDLRVPNHPLVTLDKAHNEPVLCFDIDSNSTGASGGADNNVTIFKFDASNNTTTCVQKIEIPNSGIADIKIRPDRKLVVTAGWDHRLRVFSWKKYNPLAILKFHAEGLTCVEFPAHPSNNNFWMAAGSKDKRISLWDIYNNNNNNSNNK